MLGRLAASPRSCSPRPRPAALVRLLRRAFALPVPDLVGLGPVVLLTVVVGLVGSTEVSRRPPLEVLRAE